MCSAALMHGAPQRTARRPTCSSHVEMCRARSVGLEIGQRRNAARVMPRRIQNAGTARIASTSVVPMQTAGLRIHSLTRCAVGRTMDLEAMRAAGLACLTTSTAAWRAALLRAGWTPSSAWPLRRISMGLMSSTRTRSMAMILAITQQVMCCGLSMEATSLVRHSSLPTTRLTQWRSRLISLASSAASCLSCGSSCTSARPSAWWRWALALGSSLQTSSSA
mmetsp:Transcript_1181/g.2219  ORF Transcript_1181/g.2219 Transcript_1181/m.2219 type:complete len:221 (+) Transcript_1181:124-786(+)